MQEAAAKFFQKTCSEKLSKGYCVAADPRVGGSGPPPSAASIVATPDVEGAKIEAVGKPPAVLAGKKRTATKASKGDSRTQSKGPPAAIKKSRAQKTTDATFSAVEDCASKGERSVRVVICAKSCQLGCRSWTLQMP